MYGLRIVLIPPLTHATAQNECSSSVALPVKAGFVDVDISSNFDMFHLQYSTTKFLVCEIMSPLSAHIKRRNVKNIMVGHFERYSSFLFYFMFFFCVIFCLFREIYFCGPCETNKQNEIPSKLFLFPPLDVLCMQLCVVHE